MKTNFPKTIIKNTSFLLFATLISSCAFNSNKPESVTIRSNLDFSKNDLSKLDIVNLKESNIITTAKETLIDVGKGQKGTSFSVNLKFADNNNFTTKANGNGQAQKTIADVDHYIVYLVSNAASPYPSTGDPLGADKVAGPFTISKSGASQTITFINVVDSLTKYYYVAVRCQQVAPGNEDIVKRNTNWGATTQLLANGNGRVAITNTGGDANQGGVKVDSSFVVSSTVNLDVKPALEDTTGATLQATITPTNGFVPSLVTSTNSILPYRIETYAGNGTSGFTGDSGLATAAQISSPSGIKTDSQGKLFIADSLNKVIRAVDKTTKNISTVIGDGTNCTPATAPCGDGGGPTNAKVNTLQDIVVDSSGNVYFSDSAIHRVRKLDIGNNFVFTIAGTGNANSTGDNGLASSATLNTPAGLAIDLNKNLYIADSANNKVRKINLTTGIITTFAGTGTASSTGDGGQATDATLNQPFGLSIDRFGNLYIADRSSFKIRKVSLITNVISTVAGTGVSGFSGDGGQATSANIGDITGITTDEVGNIYLSDNTNNRVRKVSIPSGIITTIAGNGTSAFAGDNGSATSSQLNPSGITTDRAGNIFISDFSNFRVRKVF